MVDIRNLRFKVVFSEFNGRNQIIVDQETGINYLVIESVNGGMGITPLLNQNGAPTFTMTEKLREQYRED